MQSNHHHRVWYLFGENEPRRLAAEQLHQFVKNDLDDLLGRLEFLPNLLTFGLLLDRTDKVFGDFIVDVCL